MQRFMLAAVVAFALVAFAYGETDCETQRKNSRGSPHGLQWIIECDENGEYLPLQCTNDTEKSKWCACYNKERAITQPSRKTRTCVCPLDRDQATKRGASECDIPTCSNTGKYFPKQCCENGLCRCVNPNTGESRTEPVRNPNLECPE